MSVISRYMTSLFFRHLCLCLTAFVSIYLVVDFIEKISGFLYHQIPLSSVALYFAAQIPNILVLITPVAALASILVSLVLLARNSEIVAFKGSGVSLYRLSRPLLVSGLFISLAVFLLGNLVTPMTSMIANKIWDGQVRNRRADIAPAVINDVWLRDLRLIEHMVSYDEEKKEALDVTLIVLDDNLNLSRRLEAAKGIFTGEGLQLFDVMEKRYETSRDLEIRSFKLIKTPELMLAEWPQPPQGLGNHAETNSDELNFISLMDNINILRTEGFNPIHQLVDLQFKFSRPFISIIMIMVGLPLGFWRERGGSVALGLVLGLILSFIYLITLELSRTMGYAGLLPPALAAWLPNCFFLLFGIYLFSYVRQ